jgi:hypothetical protein
MLLEASTSEGTPAKEVPQSQAAADVQGMAGAQVIARKPNHAQCSCTILGYRLSTVSIGANGLALESRFYFGASNLTARRSLYHPLDVMDTTTLRSHANPLHDSLISSTEVGICGVNRSPTTICINSAALFPLSTIIVICRAVL